MAATADDLSEAADALQVQQDKILDLYVERCGCDRERMKALMDEDKYIGTDEALELGLIGEVIQPISAKSIFKQNKDMNVLDKVIEAVKGVFSAEEEQPKIMAMELATASGDILRVEREEGAPAVGDAAEPDGEWLMPDNTTIVVENGVITEIRQPEEQVEAAEEGEAQEGDEQAEDAEGEKSELEKENDELKARIADLEQQLAELTERLAEANANAKTTDDLRILNMVKMGGGYEKVAASIKSNYTPEKREPVTSQAEEAVQRNFIKERIEAAKNKSNKK
jgi:ATP-dependent Clp protease protease subunit